jgi:hypothetical protein
MKISIVYEARHPRVVERAKAFTAELARWVKAPWWLAVRVREHALWVGQSRCEASSPLTSWLTTRLREAGLAGIQFGPNVEVDAAIEFAKALAACNIRSGRGFEALWRPDHPSIRPLDLLFRGGHREVDETGGPPPGDGVPAVPEQPSTGDAHGAATVPGGAHVAPAELVPVDLHSELAARLCRSPAIAEQVMSIEARCRRSLDEAIADVSSSVDVLTLVVRQLPVEVLGDDTRIEEVVTKALAAVQRDLDRLMCTDKEVQNAELMRRAMTVARRYFSKDVRAIGPAKDLPSGRPEDERITPDLAALLRELDQMPARQVSLPEARHLEASSPDMAAELGGIYLNLLIAGQRPGTRATLRQNLPKVLDVLGAGRLQVFDEYLGTDRRGQARTSDAERLSVLGVLTDAGRGELIVGREYCDAAFVSRTFPRCLPILASALAATPRGIAMLRQALGMLPPQRITEGAEVLRRLGALRDRKLVAALAAVGGPAVTPMLRRALGAAEPAIVVLVAEHLRSLPLPTAETVALRCIDSVEGLPLRYLDDLCRMVEDRRKEDPAARQASGSILRSMLVERWDRLPHERRLLSIAAFRHLPGPESTALLYRLARGGRFTQFGRQARAVRRKARETLKWLAVEGRR